MSMAVLSMSVSALVMVLFPEQIVGLAILAVMVILRFHRLTRLPCA